MWKSAQCGHVKEEKIFILIGAESEPTTTKSLDPETSAYDFVQNNKKTNKNNLIIELDLFIF